MSRVASSAKEKILETASHLFYQYGYHAVGVDTIVAESGIAKMTLYRHFPSKDDLIAAYLEYANAQFWEWFDGAVSVHEGDARAQITALFEAVAKLSATPVCLGCAFQMAAAEFPDREHPGHAVALTHKKAVIARLNELTKKAHVENPEAVAAQLFLLMDGAWAASRMFGTINPAVHIVPAVKALLGG